MHTCKKTIYYVENMEILYYIRYNMKNA
jgi:hypothetical protein